MPNATAASPPSPPSTREELSKYLSDAASHGRELLRAEVDLARAELRQDVRSAKRGIGALVVGVSLSTAALALLVGALCVSFGGGALIVGAVGCAFALLGALVAYWGKTRLTGTMPMAKTRETLAKNVSFVREAARPQR